MAATKIEYEEKIGLIPRGARVNQVQDLDMNEIKEVVNKNADELNSLKSTPFNKFKFVQKGFGNSDLNNNQLGDIFSGWSDDGTLRYPEAKWIGGPLTTSNSFEPLITIIIE